MKYQSSNKFKLIYEALVASPERIIAQLKEPDISNPNEERVFSYLQQFIGQMKLEEAKRFLRFVTGSSALTNIGITFNSLKGIGRRPIAHTCPKILELPQTYNSYLEFANEFASVLNHSEFIMTMNSL